ncbi:response regulator [Spirosoma flavum]|uniref:Response regulator n=1 Tax=Spirosoma flavum TaxID=2048557 RepID=A0ABW6AQQ6_9BACT
MPFLILSDINMPKLEGFALQENVHNDARLKLKICFVQPLLINEP